MLQRDQQTQAWQRHCLEPAGTKNYRTDLLCSGVTEELLDTHRTKFGHSQNQITQDVDVKMLLYTHPTWKDLYHGPCYWDVLGSTHTHTPVQTFLIASQHPSNQEIHPAELES